MIYDHLNTDHDRKNGCDTTICHSHFFLFYTKIKNVIQQLDNVVNILLAVARE